jgi:hypothetical protein
LGVIISLRQSTGQFINLYLYLCIIDIMRPCVLKRVMVTAMSQAAALLLRCSGPVCVLLVDSGLFCLLLSSGPLLLQASKPSYSAAVCFSASFVHLALW